MSADNTPSGDTLADRAERERHMSSAELAAIYPTDNAPIETRHRAYVNKYFTRLEFSWEKVQAIANFERDVTAELRHEVATLKKENLRLGRILRDDTPHPASPGWSGDDTCTP